MWARPRTSSTKFYSKLQKKIHNSNLYVLRLDLTKVSLKWFNPIKVIHCFKVTKKAFIQKDWKSAKKDDAMSIFFKKKLIAEIHAKFFKPQFQISLENTKNANFRRKTRIFFQNRFRKILFFFGVNLVF